MAEPIETDCPGCEHPMNVHAKEVGCFHGWKHYRSGGYVEEGCDCPLTLGDQHNPAREREIDTWAADEPAAGASTQGDESKVTTIRADVRAVSDGFRRAATRAVAATGTTVEEFAAGAQQLGRIVAETPSPVFDLRAALVTVPDPDTTSGPSGLLAHFRNRTKKD